MTGNLPEFLLARIAEDEAAARACVGPEWENGLPATVHPNPDTYRTVVRQVGHVCGSIIAADAEHIARHDPARVLAECEAKRRIVDLHEAARGRPDGPLGCEICTQWDDYPYVVEHKGQGWPCATLRLLALPFADHPDYRQEWKP